MTHTHITVLWYLNWVESTDMISQGLPWDFWTVPLAAHHRSQSVGWDERAHPRNAPGYCHQNTQRLGHEIDGTITMHVYKYIVICHMYIHAHKINIYIYSYIYMGRWYIPYINKLLTVLIQNHSHSIGPRFPKVLIVEWPFLMGKQGSCWSHVRWPMTPGTKPRPRRQSSTIWPFGHDVHIPVTLRRKVTISVT